MESFGARLKREREQRKITLDDISVATKIAPRFLIALEEEHFDELPGGIFNKGFVRAYARHLGLDENQAIADFVAASTPAVPEVAPQDAPVLAAMAVRVPASRSKRRDNDGIPWGGVAAALLVMAFAFALWGFHSREKSSPRAAVPPPQQTAQTQPGPVATTSVSSESPQPGPSIGAKETASPPAVPAPSAGTFVVLINAREDSWVSITADGKPILQETLAASTDKSIEARNQVVIKTGNVGALEVSFNGKKLAPLGRKNQVKTLTFDSNGLRP
ncbi:MAG: RodZ domain-containing protein [Terriglobales bacterium]